MQKNKILIVDDEREIRDLIGAFFEKKEYETLAVESGLLGLSLLAKENFDALISDIKMPFMDGVEFARKARRLNPNLVIIFLTGYASLETAQEAIRIGVSDYLTKPVNLEKLKESVEQGLNRILEMKKGVEYYRNLETTLKREKETFDSMKEELMNLLSHELRTPVTVMSTSFEILKEIEGMPKGEEMAGFSEDKRRSLMNAFESGRRRLISIIEDIGYYMNLIKEGIKLNKSRVILNQFLEENLTGLMRIASENKAILDKEFIEERLSVSIDKERVLDVLSRLIHNAAYHNPEGTKILLKLFSTKGEGQEFATLEVSDNGRGIEKNVLDEIFTPLKIGDIQHHRKGMGLGFSICKKVIELHQGRITVNSEIGKGTAVTIQIPIK